MPKAKQSRKNASKSRLVLLAGLSVVILLAVTGVLYHNHQASLAKQKHAAELAQQKYQADLKQFGKLDSEYIDVYSQLVQSSNLTKSQAEWDSFYDTQISRVQDIKTAIANASFSDFSGSKLDAVGSQLSMDCDHLSYLLNLGKSNIDIQYQIDEDKAAGDSAQLSADQQTNQTQQAELKDAFNVVTQDGVKITSAAQGLGL